MVSKRPTPAQLMVTPLKIILRLEKQHASRVPAYATFVRTRQSHGESISGPSLFSVLLGEQSRERTEKPVQRLC